MLLTARLRVPQRFDTGKSGPVVSLRADWMNGHGQLLVLRHRGGIYTIVFRVRADELDKRNGCGELERNNRSVTAAADIEHAAFRIDWAGLRVRPDDVVHAPPVSRLC